MTSREPGIPRPTPPSLDALRAGSSARPETQEDKLEEAWNSLKDTLRSLRALPAHEAFGALSPEEQERELGAINATLPISEQYTREEWIQVLTPIGPNVHEIRFALKKDKLAQLVRAQQPSMSQEDAERVVEERVGALQREVAAEEHPEKRESIVAPDLVEAYAALESLFPGHPNGEGLVIYHPCSGRDVSPSAAFPKAQVIYADIDPWAVQSLVREGFDARFASASDEAVEVQGVSVVPIAFERPPDMVILLNPEIVPDGPASALRDGGVLVTNNYHGTASLLLARSDMELLGVLAKSDGHYALQSAPGVSAHGAGSFENDYFVFRKRPPAET